jgi:hypothetical protein
LIDLTFLFVFLAVHHNCLPLIDLNISTWRQFVASLSPPVL